MPAMVSCQGLAYQTVAFHTPWMYIFLFHRIFQGTAWLPVMPTVAESAVTKIGTELDKACQQCVIIQMFKMKFPNAGRVNQVSTLREMIEAGRRGGMSAFVSCF